ncbi:sigma-E factor regulatory protein RseB domain-containing protein [Nocardiopsis composta]
MALRGRALPVRRFDGPAGGLLCAAARADPDRLGGAGQRAGPGGRRRRRHGPAPPGREGLPGGLLRRGAGGQLHRPGRHRAPGRRGRAQRRFGHPVPRTGRGGEVQVRTADSSEWPDPGARALDTLEHNYRVVRAGTGEVSGRPAALVEAVRADGTTAGRFWIDDETGLPLRRMTLDPLGRVVHFSEFTEFRVVDGAAGAAGAGPAPDPWGDRLDEGELRELRADGWTAPDRLSWNYRLVDARTKVKPSGPVVHLSYSDGLSVISVFVEHGRLGSEMHGTGQGMRAVQGDGGTVYMGGAGQQRRMWEAEEYVYTMLADAPPDAVAAAAASLPGPDAAGFWDRVDRGFAKFGDWLGM